MTRLDIDFVELHQQIQFVRENIGEHNLDKLTPTIIAGRVLGSCDSEQKLKDVIWALKELSKGYCQYYSIKAFNG